MQGDIKKQVDKLWKDAPMDVKNLWRQKAAKLSIDAIMQTDDMYIGEQNDRPDMPTGRGNFGKKIYENISSQQYGFNTKICVFFVQKCQFLG